MWGESTAPNGEGVWEGDRPSSEKKKEFLLEIAFFDAF